MLFRILLLANMIGLFAFPGGDAKADGMDWESILHPGKFRVLIRFSPDHTVMELSSPAITESDEQVEWVYPEVQVPDGGTFVLKRIIPKNNPAGSGIRESLIISPLTTIHTDVEITRQWRIPMPGDREEIKMTLPLRNGWAKSVALQNDNPTQAQYWLGTRLTPSEPEIALPVVEIVFPDSSRLAVMSDPYLGTLFSTKKDQEGIVLEQSFLYDGQTVPLQDEQTRSFGLWVHPADEKAASFDDTVDAFYRMMLDDVPAGPAWIHDIAMVYYDYLSDGGDGWSRDLVKLAGILTPEERARVLCCYHGRYPNLCSYLFDDDTGAIKSEWNAMPLTRNVPYSIVRVKEELHLAKSLGFRVCFYFADGLVQDSGHPEYRHDWTFSSLTKGDRPPGAYSLLNTEGYINGWTGPDTWGLTRARDPGNPDVADWYSKYLDTLLHTFGNELDAFVWDETYYIFQGYIGTFPQPVHSDIAMMQLVKRLTNQVTNFDQEKAFFVCDVINMHPFFLHIPANSMVSHGTFQDSQCKAEAWSYAMFPNWRNAFWSCNWWPVSRFELTKYGVENFGTAVAISNGWEDDIGPSEWTQSQQDMFLQLFRERCNQQKRQKYLEIDPAVFLQNHPVAR
ncbi:MAG: hypothetical protein FWH27_06845 [Planctomycetaceae bacterium]|nr:hypothetical protein [Planctomycetaceae bacterium]